MPINSDKPHLWKADVADSIDFYNDWFLRFAPAAFRKQHVIRTTDPLLRDLEKNQLTALTRWLRGQGYIERASDEASCLDKIPPGMFTILPTLSPGKRRNPTTACFVKPLRISKPYQPLVIEVSLLEVRQLSTGGIRMKRRGLRSSRSVMGKMLN